MELTWYGLSCFRLVERNQDTIVTDPYNGNIGLPPLKLKADIVTVSHNAEGHNNLRAVSLYKHALSGPGEYEIGGVFITGIATALSADSRPNVLYLFDYGNLTVAHLGDISRVPSQAQIEALGMVNILLLPVGGGQSLNAVQATELVSLIEPNIVVPMHYRIPGLRLDLDGPERFLKEMGLTNVNEESMLKVAAGSLPEETQVIMLTPKI